MDYAFQTDNAINELTRFKISFSETFNTYQFNNKWINEIDEHYYSDKIDKIKILLYKQLINGLKHVEYLQNLLDLIWNKIEYIERYKCYSSEFFELYSEKIGVTFNYDKKPTTNIDLFEKYKSDSKSVVTKESDLFNFLKFHSEDMNDLNTPFDFEKGMLMYSINMYREVLKDLHGFIYSIHMNAEFIDFKNFHFDDFQEFNLKEKKGGLCNFNLDKKSAAHLFRILIEEEVIVFDELNGKKNLFEMKKFVEQNFTYLNTKKERKEIESFNREYSEVSARQSSLDKMKHKEFIDYLILKLQARKNKL